MMGKILALAPEEFVRALEKQSSVWRGSGGFAGKRHRRDLRRRWIRLYKNKRGIQSLAQYSRREIGGLAADIEVSPKSSVIILLPDNRYLDEQSDKASPGSENKITFPHTSETDSRKQLRRLMHLAMTSRSQTTLDLINASNTYRQALPAVARVSRGDRLFLRGVYLEALGAVILPRLEQPMIDILEEQGVEVVPNSEILVRPPEIQQLQTPPDFWHRRILPNGGALPQAYQGNGISIGLLDTGIDVDHPEFSHRTGDHIVYRQFDLNGVEVPGASPRDFGSHGTHVASICAGQNAGISPQVHLSVAAVLTEQSENGALRGYFAQLLGGLNWLVNEAGPHGDGVQIVNASLGTRHLTREDIRSLYKAIGNAADQGAVVVAAIGNNGNLGMGNHCFPAKLEHVVAVGAIDRDDRVAPFSDWGYSYGDAARQAPSKPNIVGPGVDIHSALAGGGYASMNGSSLSAPCISSALALILEKYPELTGQPRRLTETLMEFTRCNQNWANSAPRVGHGCIDLEGLLP